MLILAFYIRWDVSGEISLFFVRVVLCEAAVASVDCLNVVLI